MQVRQGDILINPIQKIPDGAKEMRDDGKVVLAEGEVTGHFHEIKAKGKLKHFMLDDKLFLDIFEPVTLEHPEHSHLVLVPGKYEVIRQVEVFHDEVRQVAD